MVLAAEIADGYPVAVAFAVGAAFGAVLAVRLLRAVIRATVADLEALAEQRRDRAD